MTARTVVATLALAALPHSGGTPAGAQPIASTPTLHAREQAAPLADPVEQTRTLIRANRLLEADSTARANLSRLSRGRGVDSLAVADAIQPLLDVLSRRGLTGSIEYRNLASRLAGLRERFAPPNDLKLAAAWQYVASARRAAADLRGALELYQRALDLQQRVLGPDHVELSRTLNRMVAVHRLLGDRTAARALLERALDIREERLSADHPDIALVLGNLALMDMEDGDYTLARERFRRVLRSHESSEGVDGIQVGLTLLNLSTLSSRLGEPEQARRQLERSIRILTARLGGKRPEVIQGRSSLAVTLRQLGEPLRAESMFREALAALDSLDSSAHQFRSEIIAGLAGACADLGRTTEADSLYREALELQVGTFGATHWVVAETLRGLASMEFAHGRLDTAAVHGARALAIDESAFGPNHPSVASDLVLCAAIRLADGDSHGASRDALRAERIGSEHLRATARALPERLALEYAAERASGMDVALAALRSAPEDSALVFATWDALVRSRAIVLDEMAARHRSVSAGLDSVAASLARSSAERHGALARLFVRGVTDSAGAFRAAVDEAQQACDRVDAALAERSASFRGQRERARAGLAAVRDALPPGAALVAFTRGAEPDRGSQQLGLVAQARYFAFTADPKGVVRAVDLGDAARIDSLVAAWRDGIAALLEGRAGPGHRAHVRRAGEVLRREVWDPLSGHLASTRRLFLVADGALHLVNFSALPAGRGSYLVEKGPILHVLSTERDLLAPAPHDVADALIAFGGPAFDQRPDSSESPSLAAGGDSDVYRGLPPDCGAFLHRRFQPLPGSALEAAEVEAIWTRASVGRASARMLTSAEAGEDAFKRLAPLAGTLHVATHGYFLDESCGPAETPGVRVRDGRVSPLLRSGLALAGANLRDSVRAGEDGVLTAEEIATLDLSRTGSVTLSACDSGLGSLIAGEGVFGLRRAFEVAGARSLVMSLWKVRDLDARRWMRAFYEARLLHGRGFAEAAHEAAVKLLREQRASGDAADPSAWGAFVASGDWR